MTQRENLFESFKFGVEFTRVPAGINTESDGALERISSRFKKAADFEFDADFRKFSYHDKPAVEDGAIEVASMPMNSLQELKDFHEFTKRFSKSFGKLSKTRLVPFTNVDGYHVEGGGEHVHVEITHKQHVRNAICACFLSPQIRWFIADWVDVDSSPTEMYRIMNSHGVKRFSEQLVMAVLSTHTQDWGMTPLQVRIPSIVNCCYLQKQHNNTLEYRYFQSSTSLQHMIDNVELAIRLTDNLCFSMRCGDDYLSSLADYAKLPARTHLKHFKEALDRIGFSEERVNHYVEAYYDNYKMRRKHGVLN